MAGGGWVFMTPGFFCRDGSARQDGKSPSVSLGLYLTDRHSIQSALLLERRQGQGVAIVRTILSFVCAGKTCAGVNCCYTENDEPQPQVELAFGFLMTNCEPCRLS